MHYKTKPIIDIPGPICRRLRGIFFDIDDTFTYHGKMYPEAFEVLWRARKEGLILVPVTGRPAGWADHIARMWPVDGVIGENGALYFTYDENLKKLFKYYVVDDTLQRKNNQEDLYRIFNHIKRIYRNVEFASDQAYREMDVAVDFCEDVHPPLTLEDARRIKEIFESYGATAKISSIHVNAWFGQFDKLTTCKRFISERTGIDPDGHKDSFFFCGDSPNDEPLFRYFPYAAGVGGIEQFNDPSLMDSFPEYVTAGEGSFGFAEIVNTILEKRRQTGP